MCQWDHSQNSRRGRTAPKEGGLAYVLESSLWLATENAGVFAIVRQVWLPPGKVSQRLRAKVQGGKDGSFSFRFLLFNFSKNIS